MLGLVTKVFLNLVSAFVSRVFNVYVLEGGSRSSKTHSIIQFWVKWAYDNRGKGGQKRVAICRLKSTWLKATVMKDFFDGLKMLGLYDRKSHNKSERIYTLYDTEFWFIGLDDTQKIHGLKTSAFWINEAIEANKDDYDQLMQRCDGFAILDYNPSEEDHWIYDNVCKRPRTFFSHSTMLDNPLISKNSKEQILSYEPTEANYAAGTVDKRKWEIYGQGRRAKIEGLVFDSFEIVEEIPKYVKQRFTGIDFGYSNDVTAIGEVGIDVGHNAIYIDELCYRTRMVTDDIVRELKKVNNKRKIISESADPRLVDEIYNAGFNIHAVEKFAGSIKGGLDKMRGMKIYITARSLNAIKEFKNYTYQQDKTGKWLNEPIDAWNHIIDFTRYVVLMELLGKIKKKKDLSKYF